MRKRQRKSQASGYKNAGSVGLLGENGNTVLNMCLSRRSNSVNDLIVKIYIFIRKIWDYKEF